MILFELQIKTSLATLHGDQAQRCRNWNGTLARALLKPVMILVMGGIVLLIMLVILLPIIEINPPVR